MENQTLPAAVESCLDNWGKVTSTVTSGVTADFGYEPLSTTVGPGWTITSDGTYTLPNTWGSNGIGTIDIRDTKGDLYVTGKTVIDGELIVKGVSLDSRLSAIEDRLAILTANLDLEGRWSQLRQLGEQYRQLERDLLQQEEIVRILKK